MAMPCPHCGVTFAQSWNVFKNIPDHDGQKLVLHQHCPECSRTIIAMSSVTSLDRNSFTQWKPGDANITLLYPRATNRGPLSAEIPERYKSYYTEAALVLGDSPMASAALSRRLLQMILREVAKADSSKLSDEIEEILPSLPPYLGDLRNIRDIGNFAAHPIKNEHSGEVVDVEPGEAEWLLDILDKLFDFYFIQPALAKKRQSDWTARKQFSPSTSKS